MKIKKIKSQVQLDELLERFDWSHAFIREAFIVTPSYIDEKDLAVIAPDSNAVMKMLIVFQDVTFPGLELIFEGVEAVELAFRVDLEPVGEVNPRDSSVKLRLHSYGGRSIRAKTLKYILLDEKCWGWRVRYGMDNPFDEAGFLLEDQLQSSVYE